MGCTLDACHINISKLKNHRLSLSLYLICMYSTIFVSSLLYYIRLHLNTNNELIYYALECRTNMGIVAYFACGFEVAFLFLMYKVF